MQIAAFIFFFKLNQYIVFQSVHTPSTGLYINTYKNVQMVNQRRFCLSSCVPVEVYLVSGRDFSKACDPVHHRSSAGSRLTCADRVRLDFYPDVKITPESQWRGAQASSWRVSIPLLPPSLWSELLFIIAHV